jgi:hypothetical protein
MKSELKIWWVVAWYCYYPDGQLRNVRSTHSSKTEAEAAAANLHADFVEVVDVSNLLGLKEPSQWQDPEDE